MKHSLTSGSIWRGMLFFALPILLGNIFQQLYNTADAFIVGRFLDKNAYAAVSSSGSLIFLLVGFFNGIAVGAGVVIARYYGAKDNEKLQTAVHTTLAFGLTAGIVLTVLGMTLTPQLLRLMKTDADVLPNSIDYFRMYFAGSIAIVMYNLCVGILQAVGDSRHPLYYLILSSLVNIALDLLFVGVFHWGVWSAALATSISQFVSLGLCIFRLCHYDTVYRVCLRKIRFHLPMLKQVIHFGLPSGVQNSIIAFANVIVQSNINAFGSNAMAGCGTYAKLEGFAFLPITCFTMALTCCSCWQSRSWPFSRTTPPSLRSACGRPMWRRCSSASWPLPTASRALCAALASRWCRCSSCLPSGVCCAWPISPSSCRLWPKSTSSSRPIRSPGA